MNFLHPWALGLGALAIGLPVLVHWLTRPRPVRLPLSTIRFVREVIHQRRALHRLRNLLILALRTLAVALLAWAFARPLLGGRPAVSAEDSAAAARVVVLDVSQSMAATAGGIQALERARPAAADHLSYRAGLRANLILAGARPRPVFDQCSTNFAALREALAEARARPERLDLAATITLAADMLAKAPGDAGIRRELIVVSDFQRSNWVAADFSALPEDTVIQLEAVAPPQVPANFAILGVASDGRPEQGRALPLAVQVANFSPTPRQLEVELEVADAAYRLEGLCPPGTTVTLQQEVKITRTGWQPGQARLLGVDDALPNDDRRPFVLNVHPKPAYGLITREDEQLRPGSSYYVERALAPAPGTGILPVNHGLEGRATRDAEADEKVIRIDPDRISRESLTAAQVLVLDHPGKLSSEAVNLLASLMRRGRPILYIAAEPSDAVNLKLLSDAAGSDLQMPVEFLPPPVGQVRRDLFLTEVQRDARPFSVFGDQVSAAVAPLRFSGGLNSRRIEGGLIDDVLASYSDRSACLVSTACGAGALAVINADLARSNLPTSPVFVPLMSELVGRLLGRHRIEEAVPCGESMARYLPAEALAAEGLDITGPELGGRPPTSVGGSEEGLDIVGPEPDQPDRGTGILPVIHGLEGRATRGELVDEGTWTIWRWASPGPPGVYQVKRGDADVFALACAVAPEESNLAALDRDVLTDRLAGGRKVHYQSIGGGASGEGNDDAWSWFLVVCVGCLLAEVMALKGFKT